MQSDFNNEYPTNTLSASKEPVTIFSSQPSNVRVYFKDLIKYKDLIWIFAVKELKVAYTQTYLGIFWSIVRPVFTLFIFTIIFRVFLHVPTRSPYYLFAFSGMIAWNFFSQIATNASSAIIQNQQLIRKMYFPKLILILSKILVSGVEMSISLLLLIVLIIASGEKPGVSILTLPFFIFLNIICGFTVAVWMNTLNTKYRDLNQIMPIIIGIAIWVTPVFYPTTIIPAGYNFFVYANPLAGIIKGYRFALLGEGFPEWQYWISILTTVVLSLAGVIYFTVVEEEIVNYS